MMPRCNDGSHRHSFAFTDATNTTLICTRCSRTKRVSANETVVRVKSSSDPRIEYIVRAKGDGTASCSCPGWRFNASCKHATALAVVLAEEAAKAAAR